MLYRDKHSKMEVYNDINSELVNLFRCVKFHPEAVINEMEYQLNSREMFNLSKLQNTAVLTEIQRAARYLYMIRASFGSKVTTYGAVPRNIRRVGVFIDIQKRLESVVIENRSFDKLIKQYDSPETLFYCDPPYYGAEQYYNTDGYAFDEAAHILLRTVLGAIKGKFVLSYNDCPFIRELYEGFNIEAIGRNNNLSPKNGAEKTYKEVIIRNFQ